MTPLRALMMSEWIKLSTLRSTFVLLGTSAVVSLTLAAAVAVLVTDKVLLAADVFTYSAVLTALLASIAGILLFTSEVQHGTLATAFTAHPTRRVVALAKATSAAAFGLCLGAVGLACAFLGAALGGLQVGATSAVAANTAWSLLFTGLASLLGLGIGMTVRHSTTAISGILAWWFLLENLLVVVLPTEVGRLLPYVAGGGLLAIETSFEFDVLARTTSAIVFGAYAVIALAVGSTVMRRRDQ